MSSDAKLDDLLALERAYDDLPGGAEARILAGVEGLIGGGGDGGGDDGGGGGGDHGGAPTAGAPSASSAAPWLAKAAYVAAGIVAGASGHAIVASRGVPAPAPVAAVTIASAAPSATTVASASVADDAGAALDVRDLPDERPRPSTSVAAKAATRPASSTRSAEERADLDVARAALARGRVEACLEALERHARTYGEGQLAEEREVLMVQALASAGRKAEAAERARRFQKKYPTSLFGPAVSQAISAGE
jgi:hypothetical protein